MNEELIAPKEGNINNDREQITRKSFKGKPSESGAISKTIGTGDEAKNSIVWITIRWSLAIGAVLTAGLYFRSLHCSSDHPGGLVEEIKATWSIFMPVITLALGYIFGKGR